MAIPFASCHVALLSPHPLLCAEQPALIGPWRGITCKLISTIETVEGQVALQSQSLLSTLGG